MASPAYELILEIQALDLSIDRLRRRVDNHPERENLARIDAELAEIDEQMATIEQRRHQVERDRKRLEDEAAIIEARRQDIDGKLYGGEITASKDLLALQDEAQSLLAKQTATEDDQLELMEQIEQFAADLAARSDHRSRVEQRRKAAQVDFDEALAEIDGEIAELDRKRAVAAGSEDASVQGWAELLLSYESLRSHYDGIPVARLVNGRCDGCHIQLSAVAVDQIGKLADDAVVTCEECGRLLVR